MGCGTKPHRTWFSDAVEYVGLDVTAAGKDVDLVASALDLPFEDRTFNHVFSTQVLEHLPEPSDFFAEIARVLKPGGTAFVSTNQMYPLHEEPNDYYRFTRYGLQHLASKSGLRTVRLLETGNLLTRLCCKLNYMMEALPGAAKRIAVTATNLLFIPLTRLSFQKDYVVTAIVAQSAETLHDEEPE